MKRFRLIFIAIIITLAPYKTMAGGIDFNKLRIGAGIYYQNPYGDLGRYWNSSPGLGITGTYQISTAIVLEGAVYGSYNKKKAGYAYPDLLIFQMPVSLKIKMIDIGNSQFFISPGIANNTFSFIGEDVIDETVGENNIESEFGLFIETSLQFPVFKSINIEPFIKYQTIFSSPENIDIFYAGIKIYAR